MPTRREITRAATVDEIKRTAYALMRETGQADVRFADIARAMSMTPPGLYRYFATRELLLQALVSDAFDDLGDTLGAALAACSVDEPEQHLRAVCQAYRAWATAEPVRFTLLFGPAAPGFERTKHGTPGAERAFGFLAAPVVEAAERGLLHADASAVSSPLAQDLKELVIACPGLGERNLQTLMHAWASLHGFVCLETYTQLPLGKAAQDQLFEGLLDTMAVYVGIRAAAGVSA